MEVAFCSVKTSCQCSLLDKLYIANTNQTKLTHDFVAITVLLLTEAHAELTLSI